MTRDITQYEFAYLAHYGLESVVVLHSQGPKVDMPRSVS